MRKRAALLVFLLLLAGIAGAAPYDFSEAAPGPFLITGADPYGEGFEITNTSDSARSLSGYIATDGEGTLVFGDIDVPAGGSVIFAKSPGKDWFTSQDGCISYADAGTKKGSLTLADGGDELSLLTGETVIDCVCWGSSDGTDWWSGDTVSCSSKSYLVRTSLDDTDTSADWKAMKPGWTGLDYPGTDAFTGTVTPFSFPESGGEPVYRALERAERTIDISIYLLSCPNVISLLALLESRGVEVRILAEAEPLGVDISTEVSLFRSLSDAGAEIRLINGTDGQRYEYLHSKYAVIDGDTVAITSENWTSGNMGYGEGNRGWGAIIESEEYAGYMEEVFENDFSTEWNDVRTFASSYPGAKPYRNALEYSPPAECARQSFEAYISPILSPDNSFTAMEELMASAEERIYAEEMDLGSSLMTVSGDSPAAWIADAAERGVEVRFILDASQSSAEEHKSFAKLLCQTTEVRSKTVDGGDGFSLIHNKGIVIDDGVWLGSVNLTETSFQRNREAAVFIVSEDVSDFFAELFLKDYGTDEQDLRETGLSLTAEPKGDGLVLLTASGLEGSRYVWEVDGETRVSDHPSALFRVSPGHHTAKVSIEGTDLSQEAGFDIDEAKNGGCIIYIAAAAVLAAGTVAALLRSRGKRGRRYGGPGRRTRSGYSRW
ncbi:MAG: phospholipase D-like domain-containing protein [Methanomethylophilus sp.]